MILYMTQSRTICNKPPLLHSNNLYSFPQHILAVHYSVCNSSYTHTLSTKAYILGHLHFNYTPSSTTHTTLYHIQQSHPLHHHSQSRLSHEHDTTPQSTLHSTITLHPHLPGIIITRTTGDGDQCSLYQRRL